MQGRRYSLIIADRRNGAVRRFTVALWPLLGAVVALYSLPILIGLGARWSARATIEQLQASNTALQVENASYREATGELAEQVASLQTAVNQLGDHAAVDPAASRADGAAPGNRPFAGDGPPFEHRLVAGTCRVRSARRIPCLAS